MKIDFVPTRLVVCASPQGIGTGQEKRVCCLSNLGRVEMATNN